MSKAAGTPIYHWIACLFGRYFFSTSKFLVPAAFHLGTINLIMRQNLIFDDFSVFFFPALQISDKEVVF